MQIQEELNIVVQILRQQLQLTQSYELLLQEVGNSSPPSNNTRRSGCIPAFDSIIDSLHNLRNNLRIEVNDLEALRENTNNLVNRTVQLVNLRQEDHSTAILVFTIVTIVFLVRM